MGGASAGVSSDGAYGDSCAESLPGEAAAASANAAVFAAAGALSAAGVWSGTLRMETICEAQPASASAMPTSTDALTAYSAANGPPTCPAYPPLVGDLRSRPDGRRDRRR